MQKRYANKVRIRNFEKKKNNKVGETIRGGGGTVLLSESVSAKIYDKEQEHKKSLLLYQMIFTKYL